MLDIIIPLICPILIFLFIAAVWIYQWQTPLGRTKGKTRSEQLASPVGLDWQKHVDTLAFHGYEDAALRLVQLATGDSAETGQAHVSERKAMQSWRRHYRDDNSECWALMIALVAVDMRQAAVKVYQACHPGHTHYRAQQVVQALGILTKVAGLQHSAEFETDTERLIEIQRHLRHGRRNEALMVYTSQTGASLSSAERAIQQIEREIGVG